MALTLFVIGGFFSQFSRKFLAIFYVFTILGKKSGKIGNFKRQSQENRGGWATA